MARAACLRACVCVCVCAGVRFAVCAALVLVLCSGISAGGRGREGRCFGVSVCVCGWKARCWRPCRGGAVARAHGCAPPGRGRWATVRGSGCGGVLGGGRASERAPAGKRLCACVRERTCSRGGPRVPESRARVSLVPARWSARVTMKRHAARSASRHFCGAAAPIASSWTPPHRSITHTHTHTPRPSHAPGRHTHAASRACSPPRALGVASRTRTRCRAAHGVPPASPRAPPGDCRPRPHGHARVRPRAHAHARTRGSCAPPPHTFACPLRQSSRSYYIIVQHPLLCSAQRSVSPGNASATRVASAHLPASALAD
jgi:hypothetical protein